MVLQKRTALFFSGLLWMTMGCVLMMKGIRLLLGANGPLVKALLPIAGHIEQAVLCLLVAGLAIGTLKGRTIMRRAARRIVNHIAKLEEPIALKKLYPPRYYILLACMMSLGLIRRFSGVSDDIGGFVDLAIGAALVQGAMVYFRSKKAIEATCDMASDKRS